jgi:hypothetical protein
MLSIRVVSRDHARQDIGKWHLIFFENLPTHGVDAFSTRRPKVMKEETSMRLYTWNERANLGHLCLRPFIDLHSIVQLLVLE